MSRRRSSRRSSARHPLDQLQHGGGRLSDTQRLTLADRLDPVDYRRQHAGPGDRQLRHLDSRNPVMSADHKRETEVRRTAALTNPGRIRYTPEMVYERLANAVDVLRRLPFPRNGAPAALRSSHPKIVRSWREVVQALMDGTETDVLRVQPTPAALRMLDDTLPWLYAIQDPEMRLVLVFRLMGLSLRRVADIVTERREMRGVKKGISYDTVQRWEREALQRIASELNAAAGLIVRRDPQLRT
jgi:hypothetical protein